MSILKKRVIYKPFEYPEFADYCEKQNNAHWLPKEVKMASDINDWKINLTEKEKNLIHNILKGFTQAEVIIGDYWANYVSQWFPKPEIVMMSNTFSAFEAIHQIGYSYLNDSLGLLDYAEFLYDPATKNKLDSLICTKSKNVSDIAKSLAVFSAFAEGVQLFSSFAILLSFSLEDKLKGVGQIVSWSVLDESLHSQAGCQLFRTLMEEHPEIWTDEFKKEIYEAARLAVKLEDDFIDKAFEMGDLVNLKKDAIKTFIRQRANAKLGDLGLKSNWKNIDQSLLDEMSWFDEMVAGVHHQDFFAGAVTTYSRSVYPKDYWFESVKKNNELFNIG